MDEPVTISIKVTFNDVAFYENFIEPRQVTKELPSLVCRLLTVYAEDADLANRIDQSFDEKEDTEIFAARQAILDAIAKINEADAIAEQELYNIDAENDSISGTDSDISAEGIIMPESEGFSDDTDTDEIYMGPPIDNSSANSSARRATSTPINNANNADNAVVLNSLNVLTEQVSTLTNAVSQMVSLFTNNATATGVIANMQTTAPTAPVNQTNVQAAPITALPMNTEMPNVPTVKEEYSETVVEQPKETIEPQKVEPVVTTVSETPTDMGMPATLVDENSDDNYEAPEDFYGDMLSFM